MGKGFARERSAPHELQPVDTGPSLTDYYWQLTNHTCVGADKAITSVGCIQCLNWLGVQFSGLLLQSLV